MEQIMATDAMSEFFKEGDRRTDGRTRLMFHFCAAAPHAFETGPARSRAATKTSGQKMEDRQAAGRRRLLAFSAADDGSERDLARRMNVVR